jgi:integrase
MARPTHTWLKLTRRCGLPGWRLHDCRHSYASLLLRQNVHPSVVANQLVNASVKTTLDTNSHSIPALQEQASQKFDDIVMGKLEEKSNHWGDHLTLFNKPIIRASGCQDAL